MSQTFKILVLIIFLNVSIQIEIWWNINTHIMHLESIHLWGHWLMVNLYREHSLSAKTSEVPMSQKMYKYFKI